MFICSWKIELFLSCKISILLPTQSERPEKQTRGVPRIIVTSPSVGHSAVGGCRTHHGLRRYSRD